MADWRDSLHRVKMADGRELIGGSFRGVPFFVSSSDRGGGGRRIVNFEPPYADDNYVEDTGRRSRTFRFEAYVLGGDYVAQRDALLSALEDQVGPGTLVHPYYGTKRGICSGLGVRESVEDGGVATFGIEFTETPAQATPPPTSVSDRAGKVSTSADAARDAIASFFAASYDVSGQPTYSLRSLELTVQSAATALRSFLAPAISDVDDLAVMNDQLEVLTEEAAVIVGTPGGILDAFVGALGQLATTASAAPGALMEALTQAYSTELPALVQATTVTRQRERANQVALDSALRLTFAIEAARLAPLATFATLDEAKAARDAIVAALNAEAARAPDELYEALVQLRADVLAGVPGDPDLARLVKIERTVAVPSIVLAYQLYGSTAEEIDLVARNDRSNPGFMRGELEVLSDA